MSKKIIRLKLDEDLHRLFKAKCILEKSNMSEKLITFIKNYVKEGFLDE